MALGKGKGNIALDDIAKGITYNKEPYLEAARFAIMTPDINSQRKFFTTQNYTHKYLEKEKRSPFIEYRQKIIPVEGYDISNSIKPNEEMHKQEEVKKIEEKSVVPENKAIITEVKQEGDASLHQHQLQPSKTVAKLKKGILKPSRFTIYHPKELYSPKQEKEEDIFNKTNPFRGSRYHNMLSTLNLNKNSTIGDVLAKSKEVSCSLLSSLKLQKNVQFLKDQKLPPVPKSRGEPRVTTATIAKNVTKRAGVGAHTKVTNGGYTRTSYGGYFMH